MSEVKGDRVFGDVLGAPEHLVGFAERKFRIFGPRFGASFGGNVGQVCGCHERVSILIFTGSAGEEFCDVGHVNHRLVGLKMKVSTYWNRFNEDKRCGERGGDTCGIETRRVQSPCHYASLSLSDRKCPSCSAFRAYAPRHPVQRSKR